MAEDQNFALPKLNPFIKLLRFCEDDKGQPRWTIHNPIANTYFRVEWSEFECLSRMHRCSDALSLKAALEQETTLDIELDEIQSLMKFLDQNDLLVSTSSKPEQKKMGLGLRLLKTYLFLTIPLFRPQKFLDSTIYLMRPFMHEWLHKFVLFLFFAAVLYTLPRAEEFLTTFPDLLSWEGILLSGIIFVFIKIIHEMAHAYTARLYNVPVAHMGIALVVLYPVLYTENTASWQLRDARQRMNIGLAGVVAELYIATIFLMLWNVSPPGMLQTVCFIVVAITFLGSVLINLNPLMRFDGYYVLSDFLGYENLQGRCISFARWNLREFLFALKEPPPERLKLRHHRFLISFGTALLIYRFFLFLGIAVLVYHFFLKPLGLFLMIAELWWFIGKPVLSEIRVWVNKRKNIVQTKRSKIIVSLVFLICIYNTLPIHYSIRIPAVLHAAKHQDIYPSATGYIQAIFVQNGEYVQQGQVLVKIESLSLKKNISILRARIKSLKKLSASSKFNKHEKLSLAINWDEQIKEKQIKLDGLLERQSKMVIKSPFDGVIKEMDTNIYEGQSVLKSKRLMQIVNADDIQMHGYVNEQQLNLVEIGQIGFFRSKFSFSEAIPMRLDRVSPSNVDKLAWLELASNYGGPVAVDPRKDGGFKPRSSVYEVSFSRLLPDAEKAKYQTDRVIKGYIYLTTKRHIPVLKWMNEMGAFISSELYLNN